MSFREKKRAHYGLDLRLIAILFILPTVILNFVMKVYPTIGSLLVSLTDWDGINRAQLVGLANYVHLLSEDRVFRGALWNSMQLALVSAFLAVAIGYLLAECTIRVGSKVGTIYQAILFVPVMLPLAASGMLWRLLYHSEYGIFNQFLRLISLDFLTQYWLADPRLAMYSIIVVNIWRTFGLNMILIFAALQSIPPALYESATIDGASVIRQMRHISLPLLKPILQVALVFTLSLSFKAIDLVWVMTGGGPGYSTTIVPIWVVKQSFGAGELGYGSAVAIAFFLVVITVVMVIRRLVRPDDVEY